MSLISLVLAVLVCFVLIWAVQQLGGALSVPPALITVLVVLLVLVFLVWVVGALGGSAVVGWPRR